MKSRILNRLTPYVFTLREIEHLQSALKLQEYMYKAISKR